MGWSEPAAVACPASAGVMPTRMSTPRRCLASHRDNLGNPRAPRASGALPGGGNPHVHKPGLLADTGWAPVPAWLPFACVKRMVPDFAVVPRDRMRSSSHKLKIKFHFDMKNNFFTLRVEKGAPRGLWSPRVWGHLKPNWTPSCVT